MAQVYADPHDEPVGIEFRETGVDEIYLSVAPVSSAAQLLLFCHSIQQIGAADIAYLSSSPDGTAIKLALRSKTPILDILDEMDEVDNVWEDPSLSVGANWGAANILQTSHSTLRTHHSQGVLIITTNNQPTQHPSTSPSRPDTSRLAMES